MSAYQKDILREIKNTAGRFISLLVISALGSSVIVGIQATSIDMRAVADKTYKEQNLYDIQIKSEEGFGADDISAAADIPGVNTAEPSYSYDVFIYFENETRTVRTYSLPEKLNKVKILEGRLPQNESECALEAGLLAYGGYKIGETVKLGLDNEDEYRYVFADCEFTVTGVVSSPFYISFDRGNTSLGGGKLDFYLYLHPEAYKLNVYTDMYVLLDGSRDMDNLTEDYYDFVGGSKQKLEKAGDGRLYFTRKDGVAFDSYYQDTLRVEKLGYVFPMIFFLVAVLVSLTTMSRMVEENRTQIGIYKALGYRPPKIIAKYLIYSFLAGIIGGAAGVFLGSNLLPRVISEAYGHLYNLAPIDTPVPQRIGLFSVLSAVGTVLCATIFTCAGSMAGVPANLMRPKSPPEGKRVIIEKIPFIWNRLNFFAKVTARNIFRYKKRFIMTLIGVTGCCALLITAFGLRDSVGGIGTLQYEKIIKYTSQAYLKEITDETRRAGLDSILFEIPCDYLYIREQSVTAGGFSVILVTPESSDRLGGFVNLRDWRSGSYAPFGSGGVLITEKLARVMGAFAGDDLTFTANGGRIYTVKITGVIENYIRHYIYMAPDVYENIFGTKARCNGIFAKTEDDREFAVKLLENENVRAVVISGDVEAHINDSTDMMQFIALVMIIFACALAFTVLFILTNINITERTRELATIKVLGFYDREVAMYIYRENIIVTSMGIILGLFCGIFLHRFVLSAVELDFTMFPYIIRPQSYIYSAALAVFFAVFVNLAMNFKLEKIDMAESLKSVE